MKGIAWSLALAAIGFVLFVALAAPTRKDAVVASGLVVTPPPRAAEPASLPSGAALLGLRDRIAAAALPDPATAPARTAVDPAITSVETAPALDFVLLDRLFADPGGIEPGTLQRHVAVNPRRVPLSGAQAWALDVACEQFVAPLAQMRRRLGRVRAEELEDLARTGCLRELELGDDPEIERARAQNRLAGLPAEPMFHGARFYRDAAGLTEFVRVDGRYFGAGRGDLTRHAACLDLYARAVADAYVRIASTAHALDLVTVDELGAAIREATAWERRRVGNARRRGSELPHRSEEGGPR